MPLCIGARKEVVPGPCLSFGGWEVVVPAPFFAASYRFPCVYYGYDGLA